MALSKDKKLAIVAEVTDLLAGSKLTVVANYRGTSVQRMQDLRRLAQKKHTKVRIVKNRLVKKAIEQSGLYKDAELGFLTGQLLYAFNSQDEAAAAQVLAEFAKTQPQIELLAAFSHDGLIMNADEVKVLAALPTMEQLRGQLAGLIASPISGFTSVLAANLQGTLSVLKARAEQMN